MQIADLIKHRGPDSEGSFQDESVALAFRRLSIIDVDGGDQPFYNRDRSLVLIANGEIYNYKNLHREMIQRGHTFRTNSDCEVILHLYEEFGYEAVSRLNGMFAFALYDRNRKQIILARDRLGVKPLYYSIMNGSLLFGSEIKPIIAMEPGRFSMARNVASEYLAFRNLAGNRTYFDEVNTLPPGNIMICSPGGPELRSYWQPTIERSDNSMPGDFGRILESAVARQVVSDVPLGTQLSGGVDSSLVSASAASHLTSMQAFNISLPDPRFDESRDALTVAEHIGATLHTISMSAVDFVSQLERCTWHCEEPLAHANSVGILILCEFARERVKVLLTGEGADELFAGYPRYYAASIARRMRIASPTVARISRSLLRSMSGSRSARFAEQLSARDDESLAIWNAAFVSRAELGRLVDDVEELESTRRQIWSDLSCVDGFIERLLVYDMQTYLPAILNRQDKMSMAASLEARVPFLDNEVIDYALGLSSNNKLSRLRTKIVLKEFAGSLLPHHIVHKRKQGFGVPVAKWMQKDGELTELLDLLTCANSPVDFVPKSLLSRMITDHRSTKRDYSNVLWPLVAYTTWHRIFSDFLSNPTASLSFSSTQP
jgi:asparagine synthase (glutamine-hydrolysing)